jgi:tRNA(Ile)-lysidine synthetase-like protein
MGAPGRVRLKELFRSKGVPVWLRDRRPVLVSGGEIAWAAGCPAGEAFKLTAVTQEVLWVSIEPLDQAGEPAI